MGLRDTRKFSSGRPLKRELTLEEIITKKDAEILLDSNLRTQREIALILGISRSYVSRIGKSALKKLNKELT